MSVTAYSNKNAQTTKLRKFFLNWGFVIGFAIAAILSGAAVLIMHFMKVIKFSKQDESTE